MDIIHSSILRGFMRILWDFSLSFYEFYTFKGESSFGEILEDKGLNRRDKSFKNWNFFTEFHYLCVRCLFRRSPSVITNLHRDLFLGTIGHEYFSLKIEFPTLPLENSECEIEKLIYLKGSFFLNVWVLFSLFLATQWLKLGVSNMSFKSAQFKSWIDWFYWVSFVGV